MTVGKQQYRDLPISRGVQFAVAGGYLHVVTTAVSSLRWPDVGRSITRRCLWRMSPFYVLFCYTFVSINDLIYKTLNRHL